MQVSNDLGNPVERQGKYVQVAKVEKRMGEHARQNNHVPRSQVQSGNTTFDSHCTNNSNHCPSQERLCGVYTSKRCIPLHSGPCTGPGIHEFPLGKPTTSVGSPPLRPGLTSETVPRKHESHRVAPKKSSGKVSHLFGRYNYLQPMPKPTVSRHEFPRFAVTQTRTRDKCETVSGGSHDIDSVYNYDKQQFTHAPTQPDNKVKVTLTRRHAVVLAPMVLVHREAQIIDMISSLTQAFLPALRYYRHR